MIDISESKKIQGWMSDKELTFLASLATRCGTMVELGAWKGRTTVTLAKYIRQFVVTIDHFKGTPGDTGHDEASDEGGEKIYREFMLNTEKYWMDGKLITLRTNDTTGAELVKKLFRKVDAVFIDADHSAEAVARNIEQFRPLVRPGGTLCGHDEYHGTIKEGLIRAGIREWQKHDTVWHVRV